MKVIVTKDCKQCEKEFSFISRRDGRRGSHRVYCEVCRELRVEASIKRFKEKLSETEKRMQIRENAIKCHEAA